MISILRKKKKREKESKNILVAEKNEEEMDLFYASRKTVRELVAPQGVNPNPLDYMVVDDNGQPLYTMCFYINTMPTNSTFTTTFSPLLNFPGVTSSIFIDPMVAGRSNKQLDKRVMILDSEGQSAVKEGDRNRYRKVKTKMDNAEAFANDVESGDNQLYDVSFLFTLQAKELDGLRLMASDFHTVGREKGVELAACYSVHPEAFLSGYPTNRIFKAEYGPIKSNVIKKHVFDKGALCTLFNHTRSSFFHKNGILAGRNLYTGQPVTFDIYDDSQSGYNLIICGTTGTGKSATIKMFLSRYVDFDYVIRSIDFESRGTEGEYAMMAREVGGVSFLISPRSKNTLNMFDIDKEIEFDEASGTEYPALNLMSKKTDLSNLLMTMIKDGIEINEFTTAKYIKKIVNEAIGDLYKERGIEDGIVESLYEESSSANGRIGSGRIKKSMPILSDFFKKILVKQKNNKVPSYDEPYRLIVDSFCDYVREIYYCPDCLTFYSKEEYFALTNNKDGEKKCSHCIEMEKNIGIVMVVKGNRPYFDGQTTTHVSADTPHINFDISQLTEGEKQIALLVCMSIIQESYIKKNSANPMKAKKMIFLIDELHKTFPFPEARRLISDSYRTSRKRNVSVWAATQALADYKGYEDTEDIIKNSTAILLLKQDYTDREFIKKSTPLTDSQIEAVLELGGDPDDQTLNRKGEVCLINNGKVVFIKVDYLTSSEARFVETDINKIKEMYRA